MQLSVVIVSYNVCDYLLQCLDSLRRATRGIESEVWVVDNASTDNSVECVRELFPEVLMLANKENVGFARANNMALRQASGKYVLLLNPDTVVGELTLNQCIRFLETHPEAGAVGVHMINRDGTFAPESRRGLPTPATAFFKFCGLSRLFPKSRLFGRYHMRYLDESQPARIDVISGAFFMGRHLALAKVGYLDEDYFMYGEDVDISYRLMCDKWENWYLPFDILHYKGESTQKTSYRYVRNFYNAMLIFFRKHLARRHRITAFVILPAVVVTASMEMMIRKVQDMMLSLHGRLVRLIPGSRSEDRREIICFAGRDEAWEVVDDMAAKAGYQPHRHFTKQLTYYVFDAEVLPYQKMFDVMKRMAKDGLKAHIGIYHHSTRTIVLPNDIIH